MDVYEVPHFLFPKTLTGPGLCIFNKKKKNYIYLSPGNSHFIYSDLIFILKKNKTKK